MMMMMLMMAVSYFLFFNLNAEVPHLLQAGGSWLRRWGTRLRKRGNRVDRSSEEEERGRAEWLLTKTPVNVLCLTELQQRAFWFFPLFFPCNGECWWRLQTCARGAPESPAGDPFLDRLVAKWWLTVPAASWHRSPPIRNKSQLLADSPISQLMVKIWFIFTGVSIFLLGSLMTLFPSAL